MMFSKSYWYLTIPAFVLLAAAPAFAQEATESDAETRAGVQDIVVTAQRRVQNQQDVPIAVSTVTAEDAESLGALTTETLTNAVPALQFSRQTGNGGAPYLRGVGSQEATAGAESAVAVYVDDVYIGGASATIFEFNNIQSVEVLKGPQGTLFGRNATGGVVNVRTRAPSHDSALDARIGYGSYDTIYGNVYATGELSDTVAANIAVTGRNQREGYGRNLITGEDTLLGWTGAVRSQLLWQPISNTDVLLSAMYSHRDDDIGMSVAIWPGTVGNGGGTFVDPYGTFDTPLGNSLDHSESETWSVAGRLTHDFGPLTLVSITSYRDTNMDWLLDVDASPTGANLRTVANTLFDNAFSQELQLQSPENQRFNWIAGLFYYHAESGYEPNRQIGTALASSGGFIDLYSGQTLDSYAAFADASYMFLPQTTLTIGARYSTDQFSGYRYTINGNDVVTSTPDTENEFSSPTWRVVLDHQFSDDVMGYASYSRGFKSGTFNRLTGTGIDPETIDAYELGLKSDLFDGRLRVNLAHFWYDYQDLQVTIVIVGGSETLNAGAAEIEGTDLDISWVPTDNLNITAGVSVLHTADYTEFPNGPFFVPNPATCVPTPAPTGPPTGGFTTCSVDLAGNRLTRAPDYTLNVSGTYTVPTSIGELDFNASWYHNAGFYWEPDNLHEQPAYDLVNTSVTWRSPDERYDVRIYGRNLLDEYYLTYYSTGGLRAASSAAMPANYGIEFGLHF